ncbi:unnamed protein product [Leuciscus chuanchicus]
MEPNVFIATFNPVTDHSKKTVRITVKDFPQPPELKPTDLKEVMENTTVSLSCSAEAPCPKQPPTISWSNIPESAHITTQLQEIPNKTQSVFSHMTFKASYMDHRKNISCTATYPRKTSKDSTVATTVMLQVLFSPKETRITVDQSASVSVNTNVTLTCKSKASPSREMNYTWYKRGQEISIAQGKQITFTGTQNNTGWYSCTAQNKLGKQSSAEIQLTVEGQDGHFMPLIAGCVGGIVAVLTLSALGFSLCAFKYTQGYVKGSKQYNLLHRTCITAQDEPIDRNSIYDDVHTVTTQDNKISDDYSVCEHKNEFTTQSDHNRGKDQTEEDNHERGSDVVYAQVHMIHKKPKAISVVPEDIYAQGSAEKEISVSVWFPVKINLVFSSIVVGLSRELILMLTHTIIIRDLVVLGGYDSPQSPELKPTDLREVMENTTVSLSCSAEAPCPKQPPTISWSNIPESAHITTQLHEKPDKTQSVFSHMTFKASYMDHRKNISCTARYPRKTSKDSTVETTVIQVLCKRLYCLLPLT